MAEHRLLRGLLMDFMVAGGQGSLEVLSIRMKASATAHSRDQPPCSNVERGDQDHQEHGMKRHGPMNRGS